MSNDQLSDENKNREIKYLQLLRDEGLQLLANFRQIENPEHRMLVSKLVEALSEREK